MFVFLIYIILSPLIYILLIMFSIFDEKTRIILFNNHRLNNKKLNTNKKKLLFHAASAGEYEQLKPILTKVDRKIYFVIVTCMSPTIFNQLSKNKEIDLYCYHPLDFPWNPKKFFSLIKPSAYITTRHDVWPNHLWYLKKMKIKTFLINANLYQKSKRLKWYSKKFTKYIYNFFDLIIVPSNSIEILFKDLLNKDKILKIDDSRYEQVLNRKNQSNGIEIFENIKNFDNIIFGSISEKDLFLFKNSDVNSLKSYPGFIIIVPHEINFDLINKIKSMFKFSIMFSDIKKNSLINKSEKYSTAIIVDKVGILPELYNYTKIAYVGGGFGKGVHNTFEPLVYNNTVCYGPNIDLLNEAKEMKESNCGFIVNNYSDISKIVHYHFIQKSHTNIDVLSRDQIKEKIKLFLRDKNKSSNKIYETIHNNI